MHMLSRLCMLCSDQTCMHEPMWEMCVLFGVICNYACGYDNNLCASKVFESAWSPPCVVLVINDNLYGLMVALSYICRICP